MLFKAQVLANILAALVVIPIAIASKRNRKRTFFSIIVVVILAASIPTHYYGSFFNSIGGLFEEGSIIKGKFLDFANFVENPDLGDDEGASVRASRYPLLLDAFSKAPMFGHASYDASIDVSEGGHLAWMNKLAQWGIPMFLVYCYLLYKIFNSVYLHFKDTFAFYYILSVLTFVFMGLMKTGGGRESLLMLIIIIPGMYFSPLLKMKKRI